MVKKILVIEDERNLLTVLSLFLQNNGFQVEWARDGMQGLKKIETFKPDLVILDLKLPNRSGIGLYVTLRKSKEYSDLPIFCLNKESHYKTIFNGNFQDLASPDEFLKNPLDRDAILRKIRNLFDKA